MVAKKKSNPNDNPWKDAKPVPPVSDKTKTPNMVPRGKKKGK